VIPAKAGTQVFKNGSPLQFILDLIRGQGDALFPMQFQGIRSFKPMTFITFLQNTEKESVLIFCVLC
jgi:hypothetical protein